MHYYTKNISDFNNATRHLTRQERSIYSDLLELQYDIETPIPNDLDWICRRILATTEQERTDVERMLNEYFDSVEQGFSNARASDEIEAFQAKRENAIKAGKASGKARKRNKKPVKTTTLNKNEQTLNERCHSVEPTNNHKPRTICNGNGFQPPTQMEVLGVMKEKGIENPSRESEKFVNFYSSKGWMVGKNKMKSWPHAVGNWCANLTPVETSSFGSDAI